MNVKRNSRKLLNMEGVPLWDRVFGAAIACATPYFYYVATLSTIGISNKYLEIAETRHLPPHVSGLHPSWLTPFIGKKIDIKDAQWHSFREALPSLFAAACLFVLCSYCVKYYCNQHGYLKLQRLQAKLTFNVLFGFAFILVLHEMDTVFVLGFSLFNFYIVMVLEDEWYAPYITWSYIIAVLLLMNLFSGFRMTSIFGYKYITELFDRREGMIRWHVIYNFTLLRLQSFNMDYWWSLRTNSSEHDYKIVAKSTSRGEMNKNILSPIWAIEENHEGKLKGGSIIDEFKINGENGSEFLSDRRRVQDFHPEERYNILAYLAYILYAPLYIGGPIITFNSFLSQMVIPQREYNNRQKVLYLLRNAFNFLLLEIFLHYFYVGAITHMSFRYSVSEIDPQTHRRTQTPLIKYLTRVHDNEADLLNYEELLFYSYWSLKFLWLKFLLIWRFFRCWALVDDICPPENMKRCMSNNYTIGGFWRSWHSSYNRWLIRYLYIPLGGNAVSTWRHILNIGIVFVFVAIWHDLELHLLAWAGILTIFLLPEIIVNRMQKSPSFTAYFEKRPAMEKIVFAMAGAANIMILQAANIVGYTVGLDAVGLLLPIVYSYNGIMLLLWYYMMMVLGCMIMRYIRQYEKASSNKID